MIFIGNGTLTGEGHEFATQLIEAAAERWIPIKKYEQILTLSHVAITRFEDFVEVDIKKNAKHGMLVKLVRIREKCHK